VRQFKSRLSRIAIVNKYVCHRRIELRHRAGREVFQVFVEENRIVKRDPAVFAHGRESGKIDAQLISMPNS
jgi:hypothetical protein